MRHYKHCGIVALAVSLQTQAELAEAADKVFVTLTAKTDATFQVFGLRPHGFPLKITFRCSVVMSSRDLDSNAAWQAQTSFPSLSLKSSFCVFCEIWEKC